MTARPTDRYTTVAIFIHWLIAAAIVFQILLGWRMGWAPKNSALAFGLFQLHKSVGITILLLSLARLAWRLFNRPPHVDQPAWEAWAAKIVHIGFYLIMIGLPLTGWIIVSASKTNIPTLLYGVVPWPHIPGLPELAAGPKHQWHKAGEAGHALLVKLTYALLLLHLGAVAKHQLIDRDRVFAHMAVGAKPGWSEPRLWLATAGFITVAAAGYFYLPGLRPAAAPPPAPTAAPAAPVSAPPSPTPTVTTGAEAPQASSAKSAPPPAAPAPVNWTVRKGSTLGFVTSWSGQPIEGRFDRWTGDIRFSPDALAASHLSVTVDMASVSTGDAQRDATLPTEDWFNIPAHPKAVFTARKFRKIGEDRFKADGVLDLRGVKRPLALSFTLTVDGKTAHAQGSTTIDRTVFGIGQGEWTATDAIPAAVAVKFDLVADHP